MRNGARNGTGRMTVSLTDAGSIVVVVPLVAGLLLNVFRLDELVGRPKGRPKRGRRLTAWDKDGLPMCEDPEPADYGVYRQRY